MHSRNPGYIPGDYWMVCDRCGFDYRQSEMRQTWDGLWVCQKDWEPRHPQDFVKGIPDHQEVPVARPAESQTQATTTLLGARTTGETYVNLASTSGISLWGTIGISLDNGLVQWVLVNVTPGAIRIDFLQPLEGDAANGNTVYVG